MTRYQRHLAKARLLVYRVLKEMMIEEEMDYETYKQFTKRFEAELEEMLIEVRRGGKIEETYIF